MAVKWFYDKKSIENEGELLSYKQSDFRGVWEKKTKSIAVIEKKLWNEMFECLLNGVKFLTSSL